MPKRTVLRVIWRERFHVQPDALASSPSRVRAAFEHVWAPAETLLDELGRFPEPWLELWSSSERGHVIVTSAQSAYCGEWVDWRDERFPSVCFVCVSDLVERPECTLVTLLHLFDHLLGSGAEPEQERFSSGAGITSEIRETSLRFQRIHELGYGHSELGVESASDYFAQTYRLYLDQPHELNRLDPLVYRLYHSTLSQLPRSPKD